MFLRKPQISKPRLQGNPKHQKAREIFNPSSVTPSFGICCFFGVWFLVFGVYVFGMNLALAFAASAQKHGPNGAIFWGDREFSYDKLLSQAQALGAHLQSHFGVKPGDRVALWL